MKKVLYLSGNVRFYLNFKLYQGYYRALDKYFETKSILIFAFIFNKDFIHKKK